MPELEATELSFLPATWDTAVEYHRLKRILPSGRARAQAREAATAAVLEKAIACVRHTSRPIGKIETGFDEGLGGELDLDASLDAGLLLDASNPQHLRLSTPEALRAEVVLIMDMSLSMTGENIALVAVAAAVLSFAIPSESLALVAFDSAATLLKPLGEVIPVREGVRRVLEVPARGYTHLEAGLRTGLDALRPAKGPQRNAVLLSDGIYNVGWDPTPLASLFPHLHVIQLGEGDAESRDKGLCRTLASLGRGRYDRAERYEDLPAVAWRLVRALFRRGR